jgi:hypothetical protein
VLAVIHLEECNRIGSDRIQTRALAEQAWITSTTRAEQGQDHE